MHSNEQEFASLPCMSGPIHQHICADSSLQAFWCQLFWSFIQIHHPRHIWSKVCCARYVSSSTPRELPCTNDCVVPQLPQTSYHALLTPYSFFGLGRTNNYIENLFVGSTKHEDDHFINMEGVIPNSKVVIIPPKGQDGEWKRELYLRPGEWIHWVMFTVVAATVIMAVIVFVLHLNEKVRRILCRFLPCAGAH